MTRVATRTANLPAMMIAPITRRRRGVREYKLACKRCGRVRWFGLEAVGAPHCFRGSFGFLLRRRPTKGATR